MFEKFRSPKVRPFAVLGGVALAAAACVPPFGHRDRPPVPSQSVQPTNQPLPADCVKIYPASRFNAGNASDINRQLDVLDSVHDKKPTISVATILNAGAIITNATIDDVYANAFTYANTHPKTDYTYAALVHAQLPNIGDGGCLQSGQIREVDNLYITLVDGLAPPAGKEVSAVVGGAYDELKAGYEVFEQQYHE
jgi:hypothetical protein